VEPEYEGLTSLVQSHSPNTKFVSFMVITVHKSYLRLAFYAVQAFSATWLVSPLDVNIRSARYVEEYGHEVEVS